MPVRTSHIRTQSTVFIVDDETPMRNALQRMFRAAGLDVEAHASAGEFLIAYDAERRGCLVLDLMMPGMTGLELQAELAKRGMHIPIVFLTGSGHIATAVAAMKAGALDFIEKPFDNEFLVERVRRALEHAAGLEVALLNGEEIRRRLALLTPREHEVMRHIVAGNTSKMTGRLLGVSHRTVEIHRARVMEKMQAVSLADLVRMVLETERIARGA